MMVAIDPLPGRIAKLGKGGITIAVAAWTYLRLPGRTCTAGEFFTLYDDSAATRSCMQVLLPQNNTDR